MAKTVLVVEDEDLNLKLFCDLIEAHGYRTLVARNGEEALRRVYSDHPDLVIMDIQLPELSGLEVTRRIKADDSTKSIPVIVVTAIATDLESAEIREGGCDLYITKPISVDNLVSAIKRFIG